MQWIVVYTVNRQEFVEGFNNSRDAKTFADTIDKDSLIGIYLKWE